MAHNIIDADRLKAEIEKHIKEVHDAVERFTPNMGFFDAKLSGIYDVMAIIDSLQQEQPEPSNNLVDIDAVREDFITQVYRVLDADPTNDRANAIIDAFDSLLTVCQEQPEVMNIPSAGSGAMGTTPPKFKLDVKQDLPADLEKEIQEYLEKLGGGHGGFVDDLIDDDLIGLALHFYRLGLNARKEGAK